jgi:ABC-type lipoprotein release transport system permease subunit
MEKLILSFFSSFEKKTFNSIILACIVIWLPVYIFKESILYGLSSHINKRVVGMVYEEASLPAYRIVEFNLRKQLEKLEKDPEDVRYSDLLQFSYFCQQPYVIDTYIQRLSLDGLKMKHACKKIIEINNNLTSPRTAISFK